MNESPVFSEAGRSSRGQVVGFDSRNRQKCNTTGNCSRGAEEEIIFHLKYLNAHQWKTVTYNKEGEGKEYILNKTYWRGITYKSEK